MTKKRTTIQAMEQRAGTNWKRIARRKKAQTGRWRNQRGKKAMNRLRM